MANINVRVGTNTANTVVIRPGTTTTQTVSSTATFSGYSNTAGFAFAAANAAFAQANAAYIFANSALFIANQAYVLANSASITSNQSYIIAVSAFAQANTTSANTIAIQGVDNTQNTWIASNAAFTQAAFNQANAAFNQANTATNNTIALTGVNLTQNTWIASNAAFTQSAFNVANNASANTIVTQGVDLYQNNQISILQGGLNTANANISNILGIDATQNTWIASNAAFAQAAFNQANTASANTIAIQGVDNTQNTWIASNAAFAQAAFNVANSASSNTITLQGGLNTANANIAYIINVNNTQNTWIASNALFTQSAYNTANTKFNSSGGTISGPVIIQSDLSVTGNISFTGNVTSVQVTGNTGQFFGYASNGYNALYAGIPTGYFLEPQMVFQVSSNFNGYSGLNMQNINAGGNSSSDLFITADNGTVNDGFVDLGMGSSNYNYPGYTLIGKNDGYLFTTGNTTTGGGNMIVGTGLPNDVVFSLNGLNTNNEVARFKYNVGLVLKQPITFADATTQNTAAAPYAYSSASFAQANSASSNTISLTGVNTTQNTWIESNAVFSQAAFNIANNASNTATSASSNTISLQGGLNSANANIVSLQILANTDYTNISTTPGTYGSATIVPVITVAANGRIISVTNTTITTTGGGGGSGNANTSGWLPNAVIYSNSIGYLSNTNNLQFFSSNNTLFTSSLTLNQGAGGTITFPDGTSQNTAAGGAATDQVARNTANAAFDKANTIGTLGTQNANTILVTGGTLNNVAIGSITPNTGAFTTLTATTPIALSSGGTGANTAPAAQANLLGYANTYSTALTTTAANGLSGIVTLTYAAQPSTPYANGSYISVQGITPSGYNGLFQVSSANTTAVLYANNTTGAQTVAGTISQAVILTNTSSVYQYVALGSTQSSFVLPDTSTLQQGWSFRINNGASGSSCAVYTSTGVLVAILGANVTYYFTCIDTTVNTAAGWRVGATEISTVTGSGSMVLSSGPTIIGALNFTGSTTSTAFFGTNQTTAAMTIGGATQTGLMTIGRATTSQPIQIGSGATTAATTATTANGTISTTTLTVRDANTGTFSIGMALSGTGVLPGTYITALGTGATGGIGTYTINQSQTIASNTAITGTTQKSIDIGTNGVSGSITRITLGSATSGAISNTNINGTLNVGTNFNNYHQFVGANTANTPVYSVAGSDTNISLAFQSKGTGAIDLATGSSGVNISNGNTVTAITVTNASSGYTSAPTVTVSVPTTAGGVQATANTYVLVNTGSTISAGGTGYANGDIITVVGGTGTAATMTVNTYPGLSNVISYSLTFSGSYSVVPSSTTLTTANTTGVGTGFTLTPNYSIRQVNVVTGGLGYIEQPTVTFSSGAAAAYATVGSGATFKWLGGTNNIQNASGNVLQFQDGGSATPNALVIKNGASPQLFPSVNNTDLYLSSSGTGNVRFYTNSVAQAQLLVSHTASAVNYVQVTGGATGNPATVTISAQGSDSNVNLVLARKGTGTVQSQGAFQANINLFNNIQLAGSATGSSPVISSIGGDPNIDLTLTPKGTGAVRTANTFQAGLISGGTF
jgi:hypothetical protein